METVHRWSKRKFYVGSYVDRTLNLSILPRKIEIAQTSNVRGGETESVRGEGGRFGDIAGVGRTKEKSSVVQIQVQVIWYGKTTNIESTLPELKIALERDIGLLAKRTEKESLCCHQAIGYSFRARRQAWLLLQEVGMFLSFLWFSSRKRRDVKVETVSELDPSLKLARGRQAYMTCHFSSP